MKNRDTFSKWLYKLHNHINKMLGKNSSVSYCDIRDRYEHFRQRCLTNKTQKGGKQNKRKRKKSKLKKRQSGGKVKEKGCTKSLYGVKSMSVINIIPRRKGIKTLKISPKCKLRKQKLYRFLEDSLYYFLFIKQFIKTNNISIIKSYEKTIRQL